MTGEREQNPKPGRGSPARHLPPALARIVGFAKFSLLWEKAWPGLAGPLGFACVFLILALFEILQALPAWLHSVALAALAGAAIATLVRGWRNVRLPDHLSALQRIERDSGLAHGPLLALEDQLATDPDHPVSQALWRAHRTRARAAMNVLRLKAPAAGFGRIDPWGLRAGLGLTLILAIVAAGADGPKRIAGALDPGLLGETSTVKFDAWLTPPAYTGLAPVILARSAEPAKKDASFEGDDRPVVAPAGSVLLARVRGGRGVPALDVDGVKTEFQREGEQQFQLSLPLSAGSRIVVRQSGKRLADWPLRLTADLAPQISWSKPPAPGARGLVEVGFKASDDYGLKRVFAVISRAGAPDSEEALQLELALREPLVASAAEEGHLDLSSHPWAGQDVVLRLVAEDAIGQTAVTPDAALRLPERNFSHPVAKALAAERKRLAAQPEDRGPTLDLLSALSQAPQAWGGDTVVGLALGLGQARLERDFSPEALASMDLLMWQTVLRIDDDRLAVSEKDLRAAQSELMAALARNAPDWEIAELMAQLEAAMGRFLQEMSRQANERAARGEPVLPLSPGERAISGDKLSQMMARAKQLLQTGAREAARDLLNSLNQILENLSGAMPQSGAQAALQNLNELGQLIEGQQALLDQSYRRAGRAGDAAASQQEALAAKLRAVMKNLQAGGASAPLEAAASAMGNAARELREGRHLGAIPQQAEALKALKQGAQALAQQLRQQSGLRREGGGFDPFGRPGGNFLDQGLGTRVPDEAEINRARQIQDELQRRLSEPDRTPAEREYLERLLRRF